jgi:tRNA uracil 4-sulfurtransferase
MKKAVLLMSGGIDSPVAGKYAIDNGFEVIAVHFSGKPFVNDVPEKKSEKLSKQIGCKEYLIVPFGKIQEEIVKKCNHRFYYVLTRRMMLRIAEKIAEEGNAEFLITGDNLGQVGSQTLENIETISNSVKMEILRPILCNDKNETIAIAKKIGTYEASCGPEMCSVLGPKNPATRSTVEKIEREEERLDMTEMIDEAIKTVQIIF